MKEFDDFDDFEEEGGTQIDIAGLIGRIWSDRRRIAKITAIFFAVGVFFAFTLPNKFTATCVFVPQFSQGLSGKYSSLASMVGIDLDLSSATDGQINPKVYPLILDHPGFQLDLMHTKLHFEKASEPIEIFEFYNEPKKYQKFNLLGVISRYTIGLPRLIADKLLPKDTIPSFPVAAKASADAGGDILSNAQIYRMSEKEFKVAKAMSGNIKIDVDPKKGYLELTATMPEAVASAEFCEAAYLTLKKYVGEFKRRKSEDNIKYIDKQVDEAYNSYIEKQEDCARVMDSNMGSLTASAKVERIRKEAEYKLASQMYSELARQKVMAHIKLEESTVAFTEVAPAEVPLRRTSPKRLVVTIFFTFLGFFAGCCRTILSGKLQNLKPEKV